MLSTRRPFAILTAALALAAAGLAPAAAIINGEVLPTGARPYLVAVGSAEVFNEDGMFYAQYCGGTLIAPRLVLTAGHCVTSYNHSEAAVDVTPADEIVVGGGAVKLSEMADGQVVHVTAVAVHPNYLAGLIDTFGKENDYDMALLELDASPTGSAPLAVADSAAVNAITSGGAALSVAGWGFTSPRYPDEAYQTNLTAIANSICSDDVATTNVYSPDGNQQALIYGLSPVVLPFFNSDSMLCAIGLNNLGQLTDSCFGDSGGPLVAGTGEAARLVGVVSWGQVVANEVCATNRPGIYAQADDFAAAAGSVPLPAPTLVPAAGSLTANLSLRPINLGRITVRATLDGQTVASCQATGTTSVTCKLTGLSSAKDYQVTAFSSLGASSPASSGRPLASKAPTAVKITKVSVVKVGAKVKATLTISAKSKLPITKYLVSCKAGSKKVSAKSSTPTVVINLPRGTNYECAAQVENSAGRSPASIKKIVRAL